MASLGPRRLARIERPFGRDAADLRASEARNRSEQPSRRRNRDRFLGPGRKRGLADGLCFAQTFPPALHPNAKWYVHADPFALEIAHSIQSRSTSHARRHFLLPPPSSTLPQAGRKTACKRHRPLVWPRGHHDFDGGHVRPMNANTARAGFEVGWRLRTSHAGR